MTIQSGTIANIENRTSDWLVKYLASSFDIPEDEMDRDQSFERMGLDSSATVALVGDLGDWLGCDLDPTMAYDHPSISQLSKEVARVTRSDNQPVDADR